MFWGGIQPIPDTKPPFPSLTAKGDTTLCFGLTAPLTVTGGNGTYKWTPSNTLDCPTCASVNANPRKSTRYIVESKDVFDCPIFDTVWVNRTFFQGGKVCNDTAVCLGAKAQLYASDAHRYEWYGDPSLSCNHCPNPTVAPRKKTKIYVRLYDVTGCLRLDSVTVDITLLQATAGPDRSICPGFQCGTQCHRRRYLYMAKRPNFIMHRLSQSHCFTSQKKPYTMFTSKQNKDATVTIPS
jgi:hypothetical protein